MRFDFITIGGAVEDIAFYTDEGVLVENKKDVLRQKLVGFEYGAKIPVNKCESFFGGGAANAAVCLARLGFRAGALLNLGNDERGKKIKDVLAKEGVNGGLIKKSKIFPTGFSIVVIGRDKEHVAFTVRGANQELDFNSLEKRTMARASWIYLSSLSGDWEKVLKKIFSLTGPKVAWNPGGVQLAAGAGKLKKFLKKTEIFLVNKDEALELVVSDKKYGSRGNNFLNKKKNLFVALKSLGPKIVVITSGKDGADVYDGKNFYHKDSVMNQKNIADTTGVGDAFCSTFTAGFAKYKGDIKKSLNLAMKNAASVLRKAGAQNGLLPIKNLK